MDLNKFEVTFEPFRVHIGDFSYKKVGKVRKNFKGRYRCEVEGCPVRAQIDKRGNFQHRQFFDKHKNHPLRLAEKMGIKITKYTYPPLYEVQEKPLRIVLSWNRYAKISANSKDITGIYKCDIPDCSAKILIEPNGNCAFLGTVKDSYYTLCHNFEDQHDWCWANRRTPKFRKSITWFSSSKCRVPFGGPCNPTCEYKSKHMKNKKFESNEDLLDLVKRTLDEKRYIGKLKWKLKEFH